MVYLTRRECFCSAHRLFNPAFSDEKNLEIYGKCSNSNWHGHNYIMYVTVKGDINPETGMVINIKELSEVIKNKVIDKLDHRNLNLEVDFLQGMIMSAENITIAIWKELENGLKTTGAKLHKIKLIETENNYIEYYGEN